MASATETIVDWAWSLDAAAVPGAVVRAAARHLLDALGCGLAAARLHEAAFVLPVAATVGSGTATAVLGNGRLPALGAALANGTLVHALDFDDTHADALVHATAAVLPAGLAVAEAQRASGADLLAACVAGYETVIRLGAAVRHGFHARGFHATSVCGAFASALVAARLAGADHDTAVRALGIAGSFASGSLAFLSDGSATKQVHPGWAAHAGMVAARLAAAGATGPTGILEDPLGLYRAYTDREVSTAAIVEGLGGRWETTRITLKPYPVCQLSHATLDALAQVRAEVSDPCAIRAVRVVLPGDSVAVVAEPAHVKCVPRTPYDAKFSLPWCAAVLLIDGTLGVESFGADQLARPDLRALAQRVTYVPFDPGTAAAHAPGRVTVVTGDGREVDGEVPGSRGGPERPLDDAGVQAKLAGNVGDPVLAADLRDLVHGLAGADDLSPLTTLLAQRVPRPRTPATKETG